ncbi:recombinase family protein [Coleofasciculus sp. FACHB-64]|nr:recombinase family protein [Coleofasciculus sp. FACHB-64]
MGQIKLRKSVIYCRVSTGGQDCDRQEKDLLAYAARAGFEVVKIFRESASGSKDDRPERRKVLALAQARKIDAILVTELTRWGRSTIDLIIATANRVRTPGARHTPSHHVDNQIGRVACKFDF